MRRSAIAVHLMERERKSPPLLTNHAINGTPRPWEKDFGQNCVQRKRVSDIIKHPSSGQGGNWTPDTWIFRPTLYRISVENNTNSTLLLSFHERSVSTPLADELWTTVKILSENVKSKLKEGNGYQLFCPKFKNIFSFWRFYFSSL